MDRRRTRQSRRGYNTVRLFRSFTEAMLDKLLEIKKPICLVNMWVSEGRILETDRLATNSMHHQGVHTVAPMLDPVAYGPDGLVEAVEVRDRSLSWGSVAP